jgi:hypothetical protein
MKYLEVAAAFLIYIGSLRVWFQVMALVVKVFGAVSLKTSFIQLCVMTVPTL